MTATGLPKYPLKFSTCIYNQKDIPLPHELLLCDKRVGVSNGLGATGVLGVLVPVGEMAWPEYHI